MTDVSTFSCVREASDDFPAFRGKNMLKCVIGSDTYSMIDSVNPYDSARADVCYNHNAIKDGDDYYVCMMGYNYAPFIAKYSNGKWSTPVQIGTAPVSDVRAGPTMCMDNDGYIHVLYGTSSGSALKYARSTYPRNIISWNDRSSLINVSTASYPLIVCDPTTNYLVAIYTGSALADKYIKVSTNGGTSWSAAAIWFDYSGVNGNMLYTVYNGPTAEIINGEYNLHYFGSIYYSTTTVKRNDAFYFRYNVTTNKFYNAAGTELAYPITYSVLYSNCLILDTNDGNCYFGSVAKTDGNETLVAVFSYEYTTSMYKITSLEWNDASASWVNQRDLGTCSYFNTVCSLFPRDWETLDLYVCRSSASIEHWEYDADLHTWSSVSVFLRKADTPSGINYWSNAQKQPILDEKIFLFTEYPTSTNTYVGLARVDSDGEADFIGEPLPSGSSDLGSRWGGEKRYFISKAFPVDTFERYSSSGSNAYGSVSINTTWNLTRFSAGNDYVRLRRTLSDQVDNSYDMISFMFKQDFYDTGDFSLKVGVALVDEYSQSTPVSWIQTYDVYNWERYETRLDTSDITGSWNVFDLYFGVDSLMNTATVYIDDIFLLEELPIQTTDLTMELTPRMSDLKIPYRTHVIKQVGGQSNIRGNVTLKDTKDEDLHSLRNLENTRELMYMKSFDIGFPFRISRISKAEVVRRSLDTLSTRVSIDYVEDNPYG